MDLDLSLKKRLVTDLYLILLLFLLVFSWLMKSLQPDIAQGDVGVSVITGGGLLEDPLKLTRAPLHLGQTKVTNQSGTRHPDPHWIFAAHP